MTATAAARHAFAVFAIAISQPHAWLILAGRKAVHATPVACPLRGMVALYAGRMERMDDGVLRRAGVECLPADLPSGCIVGLVEVQACTREATGAWARPGLRHLVFGAVVPLATPIFCRGRGLRWTLPPDVAAAVLAQMERRAA